MPSNWWEDDPIVEQPSTLSRIGQGALGALKGYGEQTYETMGPMALGPLGYAAAELSGASEDAFRPTNPDQETGRTLETVAEYASGLAGVGPSLARGAARVIRPITSKVSPGVARAAATELVSSLVPGMGPVARVVAKAAESGTKSAVKTATAKATAAAKPALRTVAEKTVQRAAKATPKATPAAAEKAAEVVAPVVSKGAQASATHRAQMEFAQQIAKTNPKVGEKIWMLLDDAGRPVKMLSPDEAGAAARRGLKTTWFRNLWTSPAARAGR